MSTNDELADVLANLIARRDALNKAIEAIRPLVGIDGDQVARGQQQGEVNLGHLDGLTVSEAAKKYLRIVQRPTKGAVIARALLAGGFQTRSETFAATVDTALRRDREVKKLKRGWALAEQGTAEESRGS